jgi:hypothetical protein
MDTPPCIKTHGREPWNAAFASEEIGSLLFGFNAEEERIAISSDALSEPGT